MKCCVIGGAGFIGSNLVDQLIKDGHEVTIIDDLSTGKKEYLNDKARFFNVDISAQNNLRELVRIFKYYQIEVVFHLAAWARVVRSVEDPLGTNKVNVGGVLAVLEAMKQAEVKYIVYSSSSSIYGDQDIPTMKEVMVPRPKSPYAMQKLIGEWYVALYCKLYGIRGIGLRYFNVYGPRQVVDGEYALVIGKFMAKKAAKKKLTIYGNGEQTRAYTHVSDIVQANIKAMDYFFSDDFINSWSDKPLFYAAFNIGTDQETSVNRIVELLGSPEHEHIIPNPRGEFEELRKAADYSKAKDYLKWEPKITIEQGMKELLNGN